MINALAHKPQDVSGTVRRSTGEYFAWAWLAIALSALLLRFEVVFPINIALLGIAWLLGAILVVPLLWTAIKRRQKRVGMFAGIVIVILSVYWLPRVANFGAYTKLLREQDQYFKSIAAVKAGQEPSCLTSKFGCRIEKGALPKVGFVWGGLGDNWYGVVFDETEHGPGSLGTQRVFGSDLVAVSRLWGPWFLCSFT